MKISLNDLAVFGGKYLFKKKIHVGRPNIGDLDLFKTYVDEIFESHWLSNNGPFVQRFEQHISSELNAKHCIVMCNGTVALELSIRALGLKGEVIVPSFTFIATVHALLSEGIKPIFCDIDPETHDIDPSMIERLITPETSGILGVHLWGRACDHKTISVIAAKNGLKVIYDAAHAFMCSSGKTMIGNFGNAEVLSFHATKFCNSFEGGAVITNDDRLAEKLRLMRNFGFSGKDHVIHHGTNGKMNEISAAMGLASLNNVDLFITANEQNYKMYRKLLEPIDGLSVLQYSSEEKNNYQYVVVEVNEKQFGLSRDVLLDILTSENVLVRRYFYPGCHRMEPYKTLYPEVNDRLPITTQLCQEVMVLPTGTGVSIDEVSQICSLIVFISNKAEEIRAKFG